MTTAEKILYEIGEIANKKYTSLTVITKYINIIDDQYAKIKTMSNERDNIILKFSGNNIIYENIKKYITRDLEFYNSDLYEQIKTVKDQLHNFFSKRKTT